MRSYSASGLDRPLGDRDDPEKEWSEEEIEEVLTEEVKNPADGPDVVAPEAAREHSR